MTTLKFIMTILYVCDGDRHPNMRHKYTLQDMINAHKIAEMGTDIADVTWVEM